MGAGRTWFQVSCGIATAALPLLGAVLAAGRLATRFLSVLGQA
jgi:hypothetical protein